MKNNELAKPENEAAAIQEREFSLHAADVLKRVFAAINELPEDGEEDDDCDNCGEIGFACVCWGGGESVIY